MKIFRTALFLSLGATVLVACGDDSATNLRKGVIDDSELQSGATVSLIGATGRVTVPFSEPVPDVPDEDFQEELSYSVSLVVRSSLTGVTADLTSGTVVVGMPARAGEWTWSLNRERNEASMAFFNEASGGLTLDPGTPYTANLSVASNEYVEDLQTIAFSVRVLGD